MSNPLSTIYVTSPFGTRAAFKTTNGKDASTNHAGVDLRAAVGTNTFAAANGIVTKVVTNNPNSGYGNYIQIKTDNGYTLTYAHLSSISVSSGQRVSDGQVIGKTGQSGNVTGAHLHFGVADSTGKAIDPIAWLNSLTAPATTGSNKNYSVNVPDGTTGTAAAIILLTAALAILSE